MTEAQVITSLIGMGGLAITCMVLVTSFRFQGQ